MLAAKIRELFIVSGIVMFLITASHSFAQSWSGGLYYENDEAFGFIGNSDAGVNGWREGVWLTWEVSNDPIGGPAGYDWKYTYTIDTHRFAPVRIMVETGSGFTTDHIDLASVAVEADGAPLAYDAFANVAIGSHQPTVGPNTLLRDMPEERYGIFFADIHGGGGNTNETSITFWSSLEPMWGDLYANCGGDGNTGWNEGFMDPNPTVAASDDSVGYHVLTPIPEPGMAVLVAVASLIMFARRRIVKHVTVE